jgi:hypothetical protein
VQLTRAAVLAILLTCFITTFPASVAYGITGNFQQNTTRTNVALVVFYAIEANGNRVPADVCSGVLISPTVLLTAAHACSTPSVTVCFDAGPITWVLKDGQIQLSGVTSTYDGTAYPNPDFTMNVNGKNGAPDALTRDVAVIILKEPVPLKVVSEYAQLPQLGIVDTLWANTAVQLVGYGVQDHLTPRNIGVVNTWTGTLMRTSAQAKTISNNFEWSNEFLQCSANPGQEKGGIAFGDSGGPVFLGQTNVVLALNSYVNNPNCAGVTYHSRLDVSEVQNWINQEVSVNG